MELPAGTRLGPYEIQSLIGSGGMGEVYKAYDTRLKRAVAIKRLTQHSDRFEQEAHAIAALNHPNVCQVYDVGADYLVLEYLEGQPLRGPVSPEEAVRLGIQIADALDAAHQRGILHRDLKPANIMVVRKSGSSAPPTAKLLDFGVARLTDSDPNATQTLAGVLIGTPAYMSPEQAQGQPLDCRSDIFSFGLVLYELLSGKRAFDGGSMIQILSSVMRDEPRPLVAPPALQHIVARCMAKQPEHRFRTMGEVREALEGATVARTDATAVMRAVTVAGVRVERQASIAVLPFANLTADKENEYFADGLAEEVLNALARVPALKVIARSSSFAFKNKADDVRRIAQALDVTNVLEGGVRRAGNRVRVTAQLVAADDGSHLWSERYDRPMEDVFAVQDEIAESIATALTGKLSAGAATPRVYTPNLQAYETFLRGRHHVIRFTPDAWSRAKTYFEQAIALDPGYADPHAELALGYFISGMHGMRPMREVAPFVRAEVQRALELNPSDVRPHFLLGGVALACDYDWSAGEEHFRIAMSAPDVSAEARWIYASIYLGALARFQESVAEMARAVERDPLNATWRAIWAAHMIHSGELVRATEEATRAVEFEPDYFVAHELLGEVHLASGDIDKATASFERAYLLAPWNATVSGLLAAMRWNAGDQDAAKELIARMGDAPMPLWGRVQFHLLTGDLESAADWFERMIEHRDPFALVYARGPIARPLRHHPRWAKLAAQMNLPQGTLAP